MKYLLTDEFALFIFAICVLQFISIALDNNWIQEIVMMNKYEDDFTVNLIVLLTGLNVTLTIVGYFTVRIMDLYLGYQFL